MRRLLGAALILFFTAAHGADRSWTAQQYRADFNELCQQIGSTYAYFDTKAVRWEQACESYRTDLGSVRTRTQFVTLLEQVVDELYDPHAQLNTNTDKSYRLVPSGTDLWAEWRDGQAVITQVRGDSDAARVVRRSREGRRRTGCICRTRHRSVGTGRAMMITRVRRRTPGQ